MLQLPNQMERLKEYKLISKRTHYKLNLKYLIINKRKHIMNI